MTFKNHLYGYKIVYSSKAQKFLDKIKPIKPMCLYDDKHKHVYVKLSVSDFGRFIDKLQKLSAKAKKFEKTKKKSKLFS